MKLITIKLFDMKKIFLSILLIGSMLCARSQANVLPATAQKTPIAIKNATVHTGEGTVIENATIVIENYRRWKRCENTGWCRSDGCSRQACISRVGASIQ
jgi:hypothetical protein